MCAARSLFTTGPFGAVMQHQVSEKDRLATAPDDNRASERNLVDSLVRFSQTVSMYEFL